MTLEEAIKLIQADIDDEHVDWDSPLGTAYKISFEALKRLQNCLHHNCFVTDRPLPGETKE